jgi:hypothetical protein
LSLRQRGSVGSLRKPIAIEPSATLPLDACEIFIVFEALATELTITCGFHPSLLIAMYARIAGAGVPAITITLAPDPFSFVICELMSVSVTA